MSKLPVFRLPVTSNPSAPATMPTFEKGLGTFTVDIPLPVDPPVIGAASPPAETIDPATSNRWGSITSDRQNRPTHEWNSLEEFHAWRINEEIEHGVELLVSKTRRSNGPLCHESRTYSCSRQGSGGKTKYTRKCIGRARNLPSKRTGCKCRVIIKTYHHVFTVLGWYIPEHDHATGIPNLIYTRLRDSTRGYVLNLLRRDMSPKEVVSNTVFICRSI